VQTGRWVAAAFAAGAVVALALFVRLEYGAIPGWAAGFVLCLEPRLFEAAHYMKEDTALVFGFALGLLALQFWWRFPGRRTLPLLAVACAVAASGKYIGVLFLFCALPFVVARGARLKTFAAWFGAALVICNLPLFATKVSTPLRGLAREMDTVLGGHAGVTREVPHGVYLETLAQSLPTAVLILAAILAAALIATARRRSAVDWLAVLLPLGYLAVISCSPKIAPRYLVPVTTLLTFLAVCGAAEIGRLLPDAWRYRRIGRVAVFFALVGWLISAQLPAYRTALAGFRRDDPTAVAEWVNANLASDAVIAEDNSVNLSPARPGVKIDVPPRVRQKVLESYFAGRSRHARRAAGERRHARRGE
jgi:4-amino-4-deoxy-L-arabinose transferase-like glycosyltransferase